MFVLDALEYETSVFVTLGAAILPSVNVHLTSTVGCVEVVSTVDQSTPSVALAAPFKPKVTLGKFVPSSVSIFAFSVSLSTNS